MAVSFKTRICDQCAGKLQYIKEKKLWQCMYCGALTERQESYDGLFTIKNVVRQTLLDCAYRRLDSAEKNLVECEKIDSRYIGTQIARITYQMMCVITPGALSEQEMRGIFSLLSKNYTQLKSSSEAVSEEEEALYEFIEEDDAFATLLLVYDSLGDTQRKEYVFGLMNPDGVCSTDANNNLLAYSLKNKDTALADKVIKNNENLDVRATFSEVLSKYPDNENKGKNVKLLISTGVLKKDDVKVIEEYLNQTADSLKTKQKIATAALSNGLRLSLTVIVEKILRESDAQSVSEVLAEYCKVKLNDDESLYLLDFAYTCKNTQVGNAVLEKLRESEQFIVIPARMVISMLSNEAFTAEEKLMLLEKAYEFKFDAKGLETVLTNFLCYDKSSPEDRFPIIEKLISGCEHIPTATVENYVIRCNTDNEKKVSIVKLIFDKGLNPGFFNNLIAKYTESGVDDKAIKTQIIDILIENGLKIDPASLTQVVCDPEISVAEKISFVKKAKRSGSQIKSDCAKAYLESVDPKMFSSELFSAVVISSSIFSARAIENYIVHLKEREEIKAENVKTLLDLSPGVSEGIKCVVKHLGNTISCNLLQAYALTTTDSPAVSLAVCAAISGSVNIKLNEEMAVSGSFMKFKKYASANKERLSEATAAVCEKYKVYSLFF